MKKHLIISSVLALGMGIAQAQTMPQTTQPAPMQSGAGDARTGTQQQGSTGAAAAQGMGPGGVTQSAAQSFRGCLSGSSGSWTLTSENGKTSNISGTDDQLSQYKGEEVRIQGVQGNDGSITVASVDKVSDTCANQSAGNAGAQSSAAAQNTPDSSAMNSQSSGASTTNAPGAITPPVSNETPSNTVGSGQTTQSAAQTSSTSTTDQNAASSTTTSNQSSTANQNTTSGQNADQGVRHYSDMDPNANNTANNRLPQTASPLPLIGMLGLGSLLAGLISRRKK